MPQIIAMTTQKLNNGKVQINDSRGNETISKSAENILGLIVEPFDNAIKVAWDLQVFLKPIFEMLPEDVVKALNSGKSVKYKGFKLFYGVGKGKMFGVTYRQLNPAGKGNLFTEEIFEYNLYEIKIYFPDKDLSKIEDIRDAGYYLVNVLKSMGITPTKLTSPAAIYEEAVLRRMPIPTIYSMSEEALECAEWSAQYCREWHSTYRIGYFNKAYSYDISAAYPAALAKVPNLEYAHYIKTDGTIPTNAYWGILKGQVTVNKEVSPLVRYEDGEARCDKGTYQDFITTTDLECIKKWGIGEFQPESGWFIVLDKEVYLFDYIMRRLYEYRGGNPTRELLAKNMAASLWGRFLQRNGDDWGDYYMPPMASIVTSAVRCKVCGFIYQNKLEDDLITVRVDEVLSPKLLASVYQIKKFGEWRVSNPSEALVLSNSYCWYGDKKPSGVTISEILADVRAHPSAHNWLGVTLKALDLDRQFDKLPKNGQELLERVFESKAYNTIQNVVEAIP